MLFVLAVLAPIINADTISLNSGGTGNIIINPNEQIEGFFSGEPFAPACHQESFSGESNNHCFITIVLPERSEFSY